jgi:hypothetical protein
MRANGLSSNIITLIVKDDWHLNLLYYLRQMHPVRDANMGFGADFELAAKCREVACGWHAIGRILCVRQLLLNRHKI